MPMPSVDIWEKNLKNEIEAVKKNNSSFVKAWQNFIEKSSDGIQVSPPYLTSKAITSGSGKSFSPLDLSKKSPELAALEYSNAWFTWYMSLKWPTAAPVPPFSAITSIVSSSMGASSQKSVLYAKLLVEFKKVPKNASSDKYKALATLFYNATKSSGVMITGLNMSGPPAPLIIPQASTL